MNTSRSWLSTKLAKRVAVLILILSTTLIFQLTPSSVLVQSLKMAGFAGATFLFPVPVS